LELGAWLHGRDEGGVHIASKEFQGLGASCAVCVGEDEDEIVCGCWKGDEAGRETVEHLKVCGGAVEGREEASEFVLLGGNRGGCEEESALCVRHWLWRCQIHVVGINGHKRGRHCEGDMELEELNEEEKER
jgi:hypothetical protein